MIINCRDIVYCRDYKVFNDVGASRHPVIVVIINNAYKLAGIVCTDKSHAHKFHNTFELNYKSAGLKKPTVAICSKLLILDPSYIDSIIGKITYPDFCEVTERVAKMGKQLQIIENKELSTGNDSGITIEVPLDIEEDMTECCMRLEEAFERMLEEGNVLTLSEMREYLEAHENSEN